MKFTILDVPQRSPEWFAARAGRVTGSTADAVIAKGKGKEEAVTRRDLRIRLAQERIAGMSLEPDSFVSAEMQRGIDLEPAARAAYETETGELEVRQTGFLCGIDLPVGASLDGDIGNFRVIVGFKCPKSHTHMEYAQLREGQLPAKYPGQISHELLVTNAQEYHFVSYDDRFKGEAAKWQTVIRRYRRDQVDLKFYETELFKFLAEVDQTVEMILSLGNLSGQLERAVAAHG